MYELMNDTPLQCAPSASSGPSLPGAQTPTARVLARMLDMVDCGMLLVVDQTCVVFVNQVAQAELDHDHPLQLMGSELRARWPGDVAGLRMAVNNATGRGMQSMLMLGGAPDKGVHVAVVPLVEPGHTPAAVIVVGRRRVCKDLSTEAYARHHRLTLAESRVLRHLCAGDKPRDIAYAVGVKLSTVRTQIASIRAKTGSRDIPALVHRVARLPTLPCVAGCGVSAP